MSVPTVELPAPICSQPNADAVAVRSGDRQVNFRQFDRLIGGIARLLSDYFETIGGKAERTPIALMMPNGVELYASQFGVLKAGGFFLPIDPANPPERIKYLVEDSGAKLILLHPDTVEAFSRVGSNIEASVIDHSSCVESDADPAEDWFGWLSEKPLDSMAYMIYTSGSSGKPKGVPIHWGAFDNHNRWFVDEFEIGPGDRCLQFASIGFDLSLEEIFPVLRSGACLVPRESSIMDSVTGFLDWIEQQEITVLNLPTAFWHTLVPALTHRSLPESVRLVIVGGEAINAAAVEVWHNHVPAHVRLVNGYGPTEATITCSIADLSSGNAVNIGVPIPNCSFEVVKSDGNLAAKGEPGELLIQGAGVARGYWNRPLQTQKVFFQSDPHKARGYRTGDRVLRTRDGSFQFVGRVDDQLKIRGYRIEPDEIAQTFVAHPEVSDAVVAAVGEGAKQCLAAFVVATEGLQANEEEKLEAEKTGLVNRLQRFVAQQLPSYMLPDQIQVCDSFPLTTGGKVDVRQLKRTLGSNQSQDARSTASFQWRTKTEAIIAKAWEEVLAQAPAQNAKFHESGGDSLAAMRLVLLLERSFPQTRLSVGDLIRCPSVSLLAACIDEGLEAVKRAPPEEGRAGEETLAQSIHGQPLMTKLGLPMGRATKCVVCFHAGGGGGYYYRQLFGDLVEKCSILIVESPLLYRPLVPQEASQETIESIARQYFNALHPNLESEEIVLVGYSLGALLATEVARQIQGAGRTVQSVVNLDQPVPQSIQRNSFTGRLKILLKRLRKPVEYWQSRNVVRQRNRHIQAILQCESRGEAPPRELRDVELELLYESIEDRYVPSEYDGKMHLIRAEIFQGKTLVPADYGWDRLVADLHVETIRGDHLTIFQMPYLKQLANRFTAAVAGR